jgi:glycerol-3-phosphate acyltransferase PlsY
MPMKAKMRWWRIISRPFALLFIPVHIYFGPTILLYLLGGLSMISIGLDLYRILSKNPLSSLFREKEAHRFSSVTSFVVSVFISFLVFHDQVAYLCLVFNIFGDLAGKLAGLRFGKTHIFQGRTLEGSLGFLCGSLVSGFILCILCHIEFSWLYIGAVFATLVELFSFYLDDNFTVQILTGGCLEALIFFNLI